jgi:hypothetical protein
MRIVINKQTENPVATEVSHLEVLFGAGIVEFGRFPKVAALHPAQKAVMLSPVFPEQETDAAEDIAQIRVIEAESDEQECLGYEVALQRGRESVLSVRASRIIARASSALITLRSN